MQTPNRPPASDFDQAVEQFQQALDEFFKGNPEPAKELMSHREVGSKPEMVSGALRRTTIFRLEDGAWKVVHSQADAITTAQPAESIIPL